MLHSLRDTRPAGLDDPFSTLEREAGRATCRTRRQPRTADRTPAPDSAGAAGRDAIRNAARNGYRNGYANSGSGFGANGRAANGSRGRAAGGEHDDEHGEPDDGSDGGRVAYYFANAPEVSRGADRLQALDALADAMLEQRPDEIARDATLPPIHTWFAQFVDHDVAACSGWPCDAPTIATDDQAPLPRATVVRDVRNLRHGSLHLDSLYGDGPGTAALPPRLTALMRYPGDRAKMRLGATVRVAGQRVPLPADPASDLLRVGRLIAADARDGITLDELRALPAELGARFLDQRGELVAQRAVIGDARNDGNLVVAQLHVALLRFHNRTVDFLHDNGVGSTDPDTLFAQARKLVRWHYQWLIVNDFLVRVCREDVREFVISRGAPLYTRFLERHRGSDPGRLPVPLEFSAAASLFRQSTIRGAYDYNRFFGSSDEAAGDAPANRPEANLDLLLRFTGRDAAPMPKVPGGHHERLPSNWVIEWERFVGEPSGRDARAARRIDTFLAPPPGELGDVPDAMFAQLAKENLRRGHALDLPSAQECLLSYNAIAGASIEKLRREELLSGSTGRTVAAGGFDEETPLWFYVLKEAEVREKGERLGMFGSALVAETLVGMVIADPTSYWNARGSDDGHWHPIDGVRGENGETVDSLPALLRMAGVL